MFIFTSFCTMHCMICSVYFPFFFWALYFTLNLKLAVQFPYEYSPFMRMNILWLECSLHFRFEYPLLNIPHDEMYIRIFFITFAHPLSLWEFGKLKSSATHGTWNWAELKKDMSRINCKTRGFLQNGRNWMKMFHGFSLS